MNPNPNPKIESYLVTMSWFTENKQAPSRRIKKSHGYEAPVGAHGAGPTQNRASGGGRRPVPSRRLLSHEEGKGVEVI